MVLATRLRAAAWRAAARIAGCGLRGDCAERSPFPPRSRSGWAAPRLLVAVAAAWAEAVAAGAVAEAAEVAVAEAVAAGLVAEAAMAVVAAVAG